MSCFNFSIVRSSISKMVVTFCPQLFKTEFTILFTNFMLGMSLPNIYNVGNLVYISEIILV